MIADGGRPCIFLDRDGTLVHDTGYVHQLADYALLPGVVTGLARLEAAGFSLVIVTNQSGIGRGLFGEEDFTRFQQHLLTDLARRGVRITASYHCPHRPEAGCVCRKPSPGMLLRARDELGATLSRSWVIGDAASDVALAERAGCAGAVRLLDTADRSEDPFVARDLTAAARLILRGT